MSQINPAHISKHYFFAIHFNTGLVFETVITFKFYNLNFTLNFAFS
jgi:hypothetical protein